MPVGSVYYLLEGLCRSTSAVFRQRFGWFSERARISEATGLTVEQLKQAFPHANHQVQALSILSQELAEIPAEPHNEVLKEAGHGAV
jgi:hypothetical protein